MITMNMTETVYSEWNLSEYEKGTIAVTNQTPQRIEEIGQHQNDNPIPSVKTNQETTVVQAGREEKEEQSNERNLEQFPELFSGLSSKPSEKFSLQQSTEHSFHPSVNQPFTKTEEENVIYQPSGQKQADDPIKKTQLVIEQMRKERSKKIEELEKKKEEDKLWLEQQLLRQDKTIQNEEARNTQGRSDGEQENEIPTGDAKIIEVQGIETTNHTSQNSGNLTGETQNQEEQSASVTNSEAKEADLPGDALELMNHKKVQALFGADALGAQFSTMQQQISILSGEASVLQDEQMLSLGNMQNVSAYVSSNYPGTQQNTYQSAAIERLNSRIDKTGQSAGAQYQQILQKVAVSRKLRMTNEEQKKQEQRPKSVYEKQKQEQVRQSSQKMNSVWGKSTDSRLSGLKRADQMGKLIVNQQG